MFNWQHESRSYKSKSDQCKTNQCGILRNTGERHAHPALDKSLFLNTRSYVTNRLPLIEKQVGALSVAVVVIKDIFL